MKDINDMIAESVPQPTPDEMRDEIRALNLIVLELNERIESLKTSREAWVRKCEELAWKLEEADAEIIRLKDYSMDWREAWREACNHPLRCMLENIKAVFGIE